MNNKIKKCNSFFYFKNLFSLLIIRGYGSRGVDLSYKNQPITIGIG